MFLLAIKQNVVYIINFLEAAAKYTT